MSMDRARRYVSLVIMYVLVFSLAVGTIAVTPAGSIIGPILVILLILASFLLGIAIGSQP